MKDLIAFLNARLDEKEQLARAASDSAGTAEWTLDLYAFDCGEFSDGIPGVIGSGEVMIPPGRHIAHHNPGRVLREIKAKRALIEFWSQAFQRVEDFPHPDFDRVRSAGLWTLQVLARTDSNHPDYREDWKP